MFTNIDEVFSSTGYIVDLDTIRHAQFVIEAYVGRTESDITSPRDVEIMAHAVAFQAAYMRDNYNRVYEQVGVKQIAHSDGLLTLAWENASPFVAPMAALVVKRLSWKGSRSLTTGAVFGGTPATVEWRKN